MSLYDTVALTSLCLTAVCLASLWFASNLPPAEVVQDEDALDLLIERERRKAREHQP